MALALALAPSCGRGGGDGSASPPGPTSTAGRTPLAGFGEVGFRVVAAGGGERCGCALLADSEARRQQGLMHVRDLGGYDGMLFVFDQDTTGRFWMKDTPLPLSIAWFRADGTFVSATDMEPCLGGGECARYAPAGPYRVALEVPRGGLGALGVDPGSRLEVDPGSRCPPCPR